MFWEPIMPIALKIDAGLEKYGGKLYQLTIGKEKKRINFGNPGQYEANRVGENFEDLIFTAQHEH